jgi:hypothetical protein
VAEVTFIEMSFDIKTERIQVLTNVHPDRIPGVLGAAVGSPEAVVKQPAVLPIYTIRLEEQDATFVITKDDTVNDKQRDGILVLGMSLLAIAPLNRIKPLKNVG